MREEAQITLTSRWLPLLFSYGYFCPSSLSGDKAKQYIEFQLLIKDKGKIETGGSILSLDNIANENLDTLIDIYIACARTYLRDTVQLDSVKTVESIAEYFRLHFDSMKTKGSLNIFTLCDKLPKLKDAKFSQYSDQEFAKILTTLIEKSLRQYPIYHKNIPDTALQKLESSLKEIPFNIDSKRALTLYNATMDDFFDKYIRSIDFHVAARFYEAQFLLKLKKYQTERKGEEGTSGMPDHEAMRLWSMLSPIYVVTAHSLPKLLKCHQGREKHSPPFMYGEVDLLIFDEAGQCSPEIGGGAFAFAKRAIVVGDVLQLEPVWPIIEAQDNLFLRKFKINHPEKDEFLTSGKACSSGSIMKMAQLASVLGRTDQLQGPTLNAHYRCAPQIIEICKTLAYPELEVRTTSKPTWDDKINHSLGYLVVESAEDTVGASGSRSNRKEARLIARWIEENLKDIEVFYKKKIWEVVAVVTPFTGQRQVLQEEIFKILSSRDKLPSERVGDFFTINTVHSLQGAEKDIVIFSMVETSYPEQKQFFDNGINLINVAVSRAKSLFIVAMTQQALDKGREVSKLLARKDEKASDYTPSQILWAHVSQGLKFNDRKLLIIESPKKIDAIKTALSLKMDTRIIATDGHFVELSSQEGEPVATLQAPQWEKSPKYAKLVKIINDIGPDLEQVCIATDADQEGELIAWHLIEMCSEELGKQQSSPSYTRMRFLNLSNAEIRRAYESAAPGLDKGMVKSALTRTLLDSVISEQYPVTLKLTKDPKRHSGVGRVQCGVLNLIANSPTPPKGQLSAMGTANTVNIPFALTHTFSDDACSTVKERLSTFLALPMTCSLKIKSQKVQVGSIPGMNTSRLLAAGWRALKTNPNKTMRLLKTLYEDSSIPERTTLDLSVKSKSDSAHGIIEPFDMGLTPEKMKQKLSSSEEDVLLGRMYQLIYDSALCTMADGPFLSLYEIHAQWRVDSSALIECRDEAASHTTDWRVDMEFSIYDIHEPGWEKLIPTELAFHIAKQTGVNKEFICGCKSIAQLFRPLINDLDSFEDTYQLQQYSSLDHPINLLHSMLKNAKLAETNLCASMAVDDLLELMERFSVGRPSTYASSISKLVDAELVEIKEGQARLTAKGKSLHRRVSALPLASQLNASFSEYLEMVLFDIEGNPSSAGKRLIQLCRNLIGGDVLPYGLASWLDALSIDARHEVSSPIVYSSFASSDITQIVLDKSDMGILDGFIAVRREIDTYLTENVTNYSCLSARVKAGYRVAILSAIYGEEKNDTLLTETRNSLFLRWLIDLDVTAPCINESEYSICKSTVGKITPNNAEKIRSRGINLRQLAVFPRSTGSR